MTAWKDAWKDRGCCNALIMAISALVLTLIITPCQAGAITSTEYDSRMNSFINDARWANGTYWPQIGPKISTYPSAGCFAYACDFTKYVFGIDDYQNGSAFYSVSDIRDGDVIRISGHTFVVLKRNGNNLYTAEGAFSDKVRVANPGYIISGGGLTDTWDNGKSFEVGYHYDITSDTVSPSISDFHVGEFREGAFTVLAKVTDDKAMGSVRYEIWTDKNGQDDLVRQPGNCFDDNNIYWARVEFGEHNGERGRYTIRIYATDAAGNETQRELSYDFDGEGPVISDVQVTDVSEEGYTVSCRVSDAQMDVIRVQFPTWTLYRGQDDIANEWGTNEAVRGTLKNGVATFRVNTADHNGELGKYATHIYAYDTLGNRTNSSAPVVDLTHRNGTPTDLPTDTAFLLMPLCSQTRAIRIDPRANGTVARIYGVDTGFVGCDQFKFVKDSSGAYGIQCLLDGTYNLHVASSSEIQSWSGLGDNALWIPELNDDGSYSFWNPHWETYIDVQNSQDVAGASLIHYPGNGSDAQRFRLVPVDKSLADNDVTITCPEQVILENTAVEPEITVQYFGTTLVEGEDYTVSYKNNDSPGTATVTVTGVGGTPSSADLRGYRGYYTGSRSVSFTVVAQNYDHDGWVNLPGDKKGYAKGGKLVKGWLDLDGGAKHYFDDRGRMLVGWNDVVVDGKTMHYYFHPSGNLARNTWATIDGKNYYFRPSGNMATGWATISDGGVDKKYYFLGDGTLVKGTWHDVVNDEGVTNHYYFRPSGSMATEWAEIDGKMYFFRSSGNMATGFADVPDDQFKRYFEDDGTMVTGWREINGNRYYFRGSGAMQTGSAVIDGVNYTFSGKGVLVDWL